MALAVTSAWRGPLHTLVHPQTKALEQSFLALSVSLLSFQNRQPHLTLENGRRAVGSSSFALRLACLE